MKVKKLVIVRRQFIIVGIYTKLGKIDEGAVLMVQTLCEKLCAIFFSAKNTGGTVFFGLCNKFVK